MVVLLNRDGHFRGYLSRFRFPSRPLVRPRLPHARLPRRTAAAPIPIEGADRIAKLVMGLREKFWADNRRLVVANVNGEPGICIYDGGKLTATMSIATDGAHILNVFAVVNPDKLG
jgi:hypothetical protein